MTAPPIKKDDSAMTNYSQQMNDITQSTLSSAWQVGSRTFLDSAERIFKFQTSFALRACEEYLKNMKTVVNGEGESAADEWASLYQESMQRMQEVARLFLEATRETQTRSRHIADELMRDSTRAWAGNIEQINKVLIQGNTAAMEILNREASKAVVAANGNGKRVRAAA